MSKFEKLDRTAFAALYPAYFDTIEEGFSRFPHDLLEGEREIRLTLNKYYLLDGDEQSFVDLYYGALEPEERRRIESELNGDEITLLRSLEQAPSELFVRMTPQIFELCIKLSLTESLFCSFYFLKSKRTIWGNYAQKFPIFYQD